MFYIRSVLLSIKTKNNEQKIDKIRFRERLLIAMHDLLSINNLFMQKVYTTRKCND